MSDEDRGELVRTVEIRQEFEDHFPGPEIEVAGGFIGEENLRTAHQRSGQYDALLLSTRSSPARCDDRARNPTFIQPR
ncbi:MAG: hypothetical protein WDO73_13650 [Ignavibacteriota bacterium]